MVRDVQANCPHLLITAMLPDLVAVLVGTNAVQTEDFQCQ